MSLLVKRRLAVHSDLRLCYYALDCFFDTNEFSLLTNLAIITRDTLSNVNSVIFWPLSSLLVNIVDRMIRLYIAEDYLKFPQLSPSPEHFAFLKAIYECIDALVARCRLLFSLCLSLSSLYANSSARKRAAAAHLPDESPPRLVTAQQSHEHVALRAQPLHAPARLHGAHLHRAARSGLVLQRR